MAVTIATAADLNKINNDLSGHYIQVADIDLGGSATPEIGVVGSFIFNGFTGVYDGQGYRISNITKTGCGGLFDCIGTNAVLKNIHIRNVNLNMGWACMGGLVGSVEDAGEGGGGIYDCSVDGNLYSNSYYVHDGGMLVSRAMSFGPFTIERCAVWGTASSVDVDGVNVGGLVGIADYLTVINCFARVDVAAAYYVGGGFGLLYDGVTVENVYATGPVTATWIDPEIEPEFVGGLIGSGWYSPTVINSYYDSEVSGMSDNDGRGFPRSTAEMTYPENFSTTYIDWDFTNIWTHDPTYQFNAGYPLFGVGWRIWVYKSGIWEPVTDINAYKSGSWQSISAVDAMKSGGWNPI